MRWMLTLVMMLVPALASAKEAPALKAEKDKLNARAKPGAVPRLPLGVSMVREGLSAEPRA